ncbi:MAG: sulfate adenylyltransferase [Candidatus Zipacnadales bacterium]
MSHLVPPHGGELVCRLVPESERPERLAEAEKFTKVTLSSREVSDLIMIGMGAFSPLVGFMGEEDYEGVVGRMHLADGTMWPVPITLAPPNSEAAQIGEGEHITLVDGESGEIMGTMLVTGRYSYDKRREAIKVFHTDDPKHPGVAKVYAQGDTCLSGEVLVLSEGDYPKRFPKHYARPPETRAIFEERGWSTVVAFQTRNPLHRSHEYLTKVALEIADGLFIHPIVGALKEGDIPAEVRQQCYEVLLENYYPKDRVVLKVYPMEMRYGGPREALLHAIIRQNFGCSHLCVGRDHAGVGDYYGPFEAQEIFDELEPGELYLKPLKFENTYYCTACQSMASLKTCPHGQEHHLSISGTKLREMLSKGERPPVEFSRPEVIDVLIRYYQSINSTS